MSENSWSTTYNTFIKTDDGPTAVSVQRNGDIVTVEFKCNQHSYVINVTEPNDIRTLANLLQRVLPVESIDDDFPPRHPPPFD